MRPEHGSSRVRSEKGGVGVKVAMLTRVQRARPTPHSPFLRPLREGLHSYFALRLHIGVLGRLPSTNGSKGLRLLRGVLGTPLTNIFHLDYPLACLGIP